MNRIDGLFKRLKETNKKAFIVYITAGYPNLETTEKLILDFQEGGVDLVELGIPFSDPLADGPTIQKSSSEALKRGITTKSIIKLVHEISSCIKIPIVFMTYYNILNAYGVSRFVTDAKNAGCDGVIVPDLPPEEAGLLIPISRKLDFSTIFLASPTSTVKRLKLIASKSTGFIYYVSLTGVTGARDRLANDLAKNVEIMKSVTNKPVCVGFGISKPSHIKKLSRLVDGVIVGSAVIKIIEENITKRRLRRKVSNFIKGMASACHNL